MTGNAIFVAGSLHYDIIVGAPHLPQRDETVIGGPMRFACGGKGGNQAVAASRHGASVAFGGMVGTDQFGDILVANLKDAGVDISQVGRSTTAATGASVAIVEQTGDYGAVVASGVNLLVDAQTMEIPGQTRWLVLQNEVPEAVNLSLAKLAFERKIGVLLNAAPWRPITPRLMEIIDILVVNGVEASQMFERAIETPADAIKILSGSDLPARSTVVTLGAQGLVWKDGNQAPKHIRAFQADVVSTHGAGDEFIGAMCARLASGESFRMALDYAMAAAALLVSTSAAERALLGPEETRSFMASARLRS